MAFTGALLARRESHARVGGMSLLERAAFTLARAGAMRLVCLGEPPPRPLRFPDIPVTWRTDTSASQLCDLELGDVILLDAAALVEPRVVTELAAAHGETVRRTVGPVRLWRCTGDALPAVLADHDVPSEAWTPPGGTLLRRADDPQSRRAAERALYAHLGRADDGWFTRLVDRRISRALTRLIVPTGISPNAITVGSMALGITAGLLFATGLHSAAVAGSLLFLLSTIVDGCDGEIARLTFRESRFGAHLDLIGDNIVHVFLFAGIAVGLHTLAADRAPACLGGLLVVGALLAMATVYWTFVRRTPNRAQRALFQMFASREFAYLLVVLTVAGKLHWFIAMATVGTYAFSVGLLALGVMPSSRR